MVKIQVDAKKCIGCGTCAAMCPSIYVMEGEKSKPVNGEVAEVGCAKEAADACPVGAISVS